MDWASSSIFPNPSIDHQISILESYKAGKVIEWSYNKIEWSDKGPETLFNFGHRWYRVKV
jgi:hypothetical protein